VSYAIAASRKYSRMVKWSTVAFASIEDKEGANSDQRKDRECSCPYKHPCKFNCSGRIA
jgi:hypothetical protein